MVASLELAKKQITDDAAQLAAELALLKRSNSELLQVVLIFPFFIQFLTRHMLLANWGFEAAAIQVQDRRRTTDAII